MAFWWMSLHLGILLRIHNYLSLYKYLYKTYTQYLIVLKNIVVKIGSGLGLGLGLPRVKLLEALLSAYLIS